MVHTGNASVMQNKGINSVDQMNESYFNRWKFFEAIATSQQANALSL